MYKVKKTRTLGPVFTSKVRTLYLEVLRLTLCGYKRIINNIDNFGPNGFK